MNKDIFKMTEWIKFESIKMGCVVHPPCWSRVMLEYTTQHYIQRVLEYLQEGRL